MVPTHQLVAVNTAPDSENRIHADDVAAEYGFQAGLVPGVDVYAYLTWGPVTKWGRDWLAHGTGVLRLNAPCYDGDDIEVRITSEDDNNIEVVASRLSGRRREPIATLRAELPDTKPEAIRPALAAAPLPEPEHREPADDASLQRGRELGTVVRALSVADATQYRADVSEPHPIFDELAHPGWLLQGANDCLAMTVRLGPWMHVGSTIEHVAAIPIGASVEYRSVVTDRYNRNGHGFVENRVEVIADGAVTQRIAHVSIYEPRDDAHAS